MVNNSDARPSTKDNDDLAALWQQQPALTINVDEVIALAKSQQRKQRLYILLDLLSLLPLLVILFVDLRLSPLLRLFILVNAIVAITVVSYFLKLRWQAAFGHYKNTTEYIEGSLQQLKNNARIANINKHLGWVAALTITIIVLVQLYTGEDELIGAFVRIGIITALLLPWTIWAYKREKRFLREVANFKAKITK